MLAVREMHLDFLKPARLDDLLQCDRGPGGAPLAPVSWSRRNSSAAMSVCCVHGCASPACTPPTFRPRALPAWLLPRHPDPGDPDLMIDVLMMLAAAPVAGAAARRRGRRPPRPPTAGLNYVAAGAARQLAGADRDDAVAGRLGDELVRDLPQDERVQPRQPRGRGVRGPLLVRRRTQRAVPHLDRAQPRGHRPGGDLRGRLPRVHPPAPAAQEHRCAQPAGRRAARDARDPGARSRPPRAQPRVAGERRLHGARTSAWSAPCSAS